MPARRLTAVPTWIRRFDVAAQDSADAGEARFVGHLALALEARGDVAAGTEVSITHVRPPRKPQDVMAVHSLGSVPLTVEEQQMVEVFVDNAMGELLAIERRSRRNTLKEYIVRPHVLPVPDTDGTVKYNRYSCVGFVVEAYRHAEVTILDTDEASLPPVSLDVLQEAYPLLRRLVGDPGEQETLRDIGLGGGGPWPVVLPGYVLHALDRPSEYIREEAYDARPGDGRFPREEARQAPPASRPQN